jgi:MoaA/NifB/PqqE/SkfB family radical SAM enzyme
MQAIDDLLAMFSFSLDDLYHHTAPLCRPVDLERKVDNYRKAQHSFDTRDEVCAGLPVQMHLEPSGDCTAACACCPRGAGRIARGGMLTLQHFHSAFDQLKECLANVVVSGWGEPLSNPETPAMIAEATGAGVSTFLNTNGTLLEERIDALLESGVAQVNVALDGATSTGCHTYSAAYPFDCVVRGVHELRRRKERRGSSHPAIVGLFVITERDSGNTEHLRDWALSIGADEVRFKRMHTVMPGMRLRRPTPTGNPLSVALEKLGADSSEALDWSPKGCQHPWESIFVACTGEIAVCSFDPFLESLLGRCGDRLASLWNGERIREIRRWHCLEEPTALAPCSGCNRLPGYFRLPKAEEGPKPMLS